MYNFKKGSRKSFNLKITWLMKLPWKKWQMPPMLTRLFCANDKHGIIKNEVKNINLKLITIDVKIQSSNGRFASAAALSSAQLSVNSNWESEPPECRQAEQKQVSIVSAVIFAWAAFQNAKSLIGHFSTWWVFSRIGVQAY